MPYNTCGSYEKMKRKAKDRILWRRGLKPAVGRTHKNERINALSLSTRHEELTQNEKIFKQAVVRGTTNPAPAAT